MRLDAFGAPDSIQFIERGWANANAIVIDGAQPTLIDGGHYRYVDQMVAMLAAQGIDAAALRLIVSTHSHWDHASANQALRKLSGGEVVLGSLTADWMRSADRHSMWLSYFGVAAPLQTADRVLLPASAVVLGGITWEVIALPGHAPDLIGLFEPQSRLLISADALLPAGDCGIMNVLVHGWQVLDDALASVGRMRQLNPQLVLPGHGAIITDVPHALDRLTHRLQRFQRDTAYLVSHFARRVLMAYILEADPLAPEVVVALIVALPWIAEYAALIDKQPAALMQQALDALLKSGALMIEDGLLITHVAR